MRELFIIAERMDKADSDAKISLYYYDNIAKRMEYIHSSVIDAVTINQRKEVTNASQAEVMHEHYHRVMDRIESNFWGKIWSVHQTHFHKNFTEFVNCPFTCLMEISQCIRKISEES